MAVAADLLEGDKEIAAFLCSVGMHYSERSVRRWRHSASDPIPHRVVRRVVRARRDAVLAWGRRHNPHLDP